MIAELLKALNVFVFSMLKFILGPLTGYAYQLHLITTLICTIAGMMVSVVVFTYFGQWLRTRLLKRFFKNKSENMKPDSRYMTFIKKYGLGGIAFLTPLILTPIGGTLLAVGMGKQKSKIILYMFVSSVFWALVFCLTIYEFGHPVMQFLIDLIK